MRLPIPAAAMLLVLTFEAGMLAGIWTLRYVVARRRRRYGALHAEHEYERVAN